MPINRKSYIVLDYLLAAVERAFPEQWAQSPTYAIQCAIADAAAVERPASPAQRKGEASARTTGPGKSGHKNKPDTQKGRKV